MGKDLRLSAVVLVAAMASAATTASSSQSTPTVTWQAVQERLAAGANDEARTRDAIENWRRIASSDSHDFSVYANFLLANPGWPEESKLRSYAERRVDADVNEPSVILAFFAKYPARSAQAKAIHALTVARMGKQSEAQKMARDAWASGAMDAKWEDRLRMQFASALTPEDHLRRADSALWQRRPEIAERLLASVPVTRQAVVAARIAFQRKSPNAAALMGPADPVGMLDAGYLADKARWLTDNGDLAAARSLLGNRTALMQRPTDPEKWYEVLLAQARAANNDNQFSTAFAIASKVDDAFPRGTDISAQSLGVRDDYTSLTWLAGMIALNKLNRPADAEAMFDRYANGAKSGQTSSKGHYWAGRAALAAGRQSQATAHFEKASSYPDQYYGQLALERLKRRVNPDALASAVRPSASERAAFMARPVVRAASLLGRNGQTRDQSLFIRAIADNAQTDTELALAGELAQVLGRPDLGVMAARSAGRNGLSAAPDYSFPRMNVPLSDRSNWTMIHAITRQESQFDRAIVSHANAHGLMQLLPSTAREVAGKIGMSFNQSSLYDPNYNVQLGSAYFQQLLRYYNGSYPLAIAAYNGGMGRVNRWLQSNGDPRLPGVDMVQWIEDIPIFETRNYVQRVLENAVIYDMLSPVQSTADLAPLSRFLGKSLPG
ncbi:soluble lytic murein transglycosylase [Sphingobium sp. B7D2B]|uniref:lytic transglycosylase domain-containing protein n=1 Tax=Sphingobium sp. B7D2B TaxID=2940583 RepID=UPI002224E3D9|nr:lytic transglycosylase domain-containing protein [Sphingobium sp. B7D2B]MCW2366168.1 soluble lytic murein transglycosylase [Sphingobium sp. B7D2B]